MKSSPKMEVGVFVSVFFWIANSMNVLDGLSAKNRFNRKIQSNCWEMPGLFGPFTYFYLSIPPKEKWTGKCRARRRDRTFFVEEPTPKKNRLAATGSLYECILYYGSVYVYIYIIYLYIISWSFQRSLPSHLVNSSCSNSIKGWKFSHFFWRSHFSRIGNHLIGTPTSSSPWFWKHIESLFEEAYCTIHIYIYRILDFCYKYLQWGWYSFECVLSLFMNITNMFYCQPFIVTENLMLQIWAVIISPWVIKGMKS